MSRTPQIRPKYNLSVPVPAATILSEIKQLLSENTDIKGRIIENHVYLRLPEKDQHYWSPELRVTIIDEDNYTSVRGIAGPNGKVWATFMVFYGLAIMLLIFGGSLGISQWYLGIDTFWIWSIPVSVFIYGLIILAAKYGQRLGYSQLLLLRDFLDEAIKKAESNR